MSARSNGTMEDGFRLPILPSDGSLQSHLTALDLLTARLSTLTTRTRWPARIPLNSKASFSGCLIHTNDVKVNVGGDWWIEMTAEEAVEYVKRRKKALLLEHAKMQERSSLGQLQRGSLTVTAETAIRTAPLPPTIAFNPFSRPPAVAGPSKPRAVPKSELEEKATRIDMPEVKRQQSSNTAGTDEHSLSDVLEKLVESQQTVTNGTGKSNGTRSGIDGSMVNEAGLPILEIREDAHGRPLDAIPIDSDNDLAPTLPPISEKLLDPYWSEEAVARRAALRRKVFHEDESSEEDTRKVVLPPLQPQQPLAFSASPTTSELSRPTAPPSPIRQSSITQIPKSILKPPARKKSVSFDQSIPLPPDSPGASTSGADARIAGTVFPMPTGEFEPRTVPVIQEPKPAMKKRVGETGFAGFKRGFLGGSAKASTSTATANSATSDRKPSLFAQRLAQEEDEEVILPSPPLPVEPPTRLPAETRPAVKLPKLSESSSASIKPSVIEKMGEQPVMSSTRNIATIASLSNGNHEASSDTDEYDEADDEDLDDNSDSDEYNLDDNLLAREAALEYHRRRAYLPRNSNEEDGEEGGVMLGLPQITDGARIVNPTPEDLRRFVRVGKLENGNLVFAPGEAGWSDEEGEINGDEEKKKGKRLKEQMKRRLMGLDEEVSLPGEGLPVSEGNPQVVEDVGLPPVVSADIMESRPTIISSSSMANGSSPPADQGLMKKVSRFKAARMGI